MNDGFEVVVDRVRPKLCVEPDCKVIDDLLSLCKGAKVRVAVVLSFFFYGVAFSLRSFDTLDFAWGGGADHVGAKLSGRKSLNAVKEKKRGHGKGEMFDVDKWEGGTEGKRGGETRT